MVRDGARRLHEEKSTSGVFMKFLGALLTGLSQSRNRIRADFTLPQLHAELAGEQESSRKNPNGDDAS
jgi:hypothetical protein